LAIPYPLITTPRIPRLQVARYARKTGVLPRAFQQYLGFGAWMQHQWSPFMATMTGGHWMDHMHYTLRYEVRGRAGWWAHRGGG
jgi:hypothetical protein